jgi:rRNA maturation endonuclease Nob1
MELPSTMLMHSGIYCTMCGRHYLMAEDRCVICGGRLKPSQEVKKNE